MHHCRVTPQESNATRKSKDVAVTRTGSSNVLAPAMNEHQLQKLLTREWAERGLTLGGERLFLAAWEVMDNYRVNDAHRGFGRPAADFVFLDSQGRLVVMELKMRVRSPQDSWAVLCQVTHRAHVLLQNYSIERLSSVYRACHSGDHGRVITKDLPVLEEAYLDFFTAKEMPVCSPMRARRVVAACDYGPRWPEIRDMFAVGDRAAVCQVLAAYSDKGQPAKEFSRWLQLPPDAGARMAGEVATLSL